VPLYGFVKPGFEKVKEVFAEILKDDIGGGVAVYIKGEKVIELWGGHFDENREAEWQRNTLTNVYSTSKGITGLCMLLLAQRGLINFDAPVTQYWPEFGVNQKHDVTVGELFSHQAGLPFFDTSFTIEQLLTSTPTDEALEDPEKRKEWIATLSNQKPHWEFSKGTTGYHAFTIGWFASELLRRIDPKHRRIARFFQEEVLPLIKDPSWLKKSPEETQLTADGTPLSDFYFGLTKQQSQISDRIAPMEKLKFRKAVEAENQLLKLKDPTPLWQRTVLCIKDFTPLAAKYLEVPAAVGFATAPTIAALYSRFADGSIISKEILQKGLTAAAEESDDLVLGFKSMWSKCCFCLTAKSGFLTPYHAGAFHHPGAGGSIGWGDWEHGLGFGFVTNNFKEDMISPNSRCILLVEAVYSALSALSGSK